jgi:hypothetical protein
MKFKPVKAKDLTGEALDAILDGIGDDYVACTNLLSADWERLTQFFLDKLLSGNTLWIDQVISWAGDDPSNPAAHRALSLYVAHMNNYGRHNDLPILIQAWDIRTRLRPAPPMAPQGRPPVFMRDHWIILETESVARQLGIRPTRGPTSSKPSGAYFVSLFWRRRKGIDLPEGTINEIYWKRKNLPARIEALMAPAVQ